MNLMTAAMSLSTIWGKAWPILLAILFFGLIIFIHELGHFLCAKWMGVKVNEFSMGMGPALFKFGKKETTYAVRCFPIGGFVSMEGEDSESEDGRAFGRKPVWRRFIIVVAGAVMNLVLGLVLVTIMVSQQNLVGTTQIAKFDNDAVSSGYGLKAGDRIKSINGLRIISSYDVQFGLSRDKDGTVDMVVERDGKTVKLNGVKFATEEYEGHTMIKYDFFLYGEKKTVGNVLKEAGLETVTFARTVWISLVDLVTGQYGFSDLSGPIGTVSVVAKSASMGIGSLLMIMSFITINVGIFNLLPLPALDGGKIFLLLFEGITRKKINKKFEWIVNAVGLGLLMLLMLAVTFSDITKLFGR